MTAPTTGRPSEWGRPREPGPGQTPRDPRVPPHAPACVLPRVLAIVVDRAALARLQESVRREAVVVACTTVSEALAVARAASIRVAVLEERDAHGTPTSGLIRTLREACAELPILAYCSPTTSAGQSIVAAVQAGATGLLVRGVDDVGTVVRSAIAGAAERATAAAVLRSLGPDLPSQIGTIVEQCVTRTARPLRVAQLAAVLGVHRKTVTLRLQAAGYPDPRTLIGWCRLLHAAQALGSTAVAAERVAVELEFPSPTAMRNLLRRYTGLRPGEVRARGGLPPVLALFRATLHGRSRGSSSDGPPRPDSRVAGASMADRRSTGLHA